MPDPFINHSSRFHQSLALRLSFQGMISIACFAIDVPSPETQFSRYLCYKIQYELAGSEASAECFKCGEKVPQSVYVDVDLLKSGFLMKLE
jgi:hypothetical protein